LEGEKSQSKVLLSGIEAARQQARYFFNPASIGQRRSQLCTYSNGCGAERSVTL
jgi:hypothetical protein